MTFDGYWEIKESLEAERQARINSLPPIDKSGDRDKLFQTCQVAWQALQERNKPRDYEKERKEREEKERQQREWNANYYTPRITGRIPSCIEEAVSTGREEVCAVHQNDARLMGVWKESSELVKKVVEESFKSKFAPDFEIFAKGNGENMSLWVRGYVPSSF